MPVRDDINERLEVVLADHVSEAPSRRLAIQNVAVMSGWSVAVLALNTSIFDLRSGASVKTGLHGMLNVLVSWGGQVAYGIQPGNAAACFTQAAICASSSVSSSWMSIQRASLLRSVPPGGIGCSDIPWKKVTLT